MFSDLRFFKLPADGETPPEGRDAKVLFRCGMPKPALQHMLAQCPDITWIHSCTAGFEPMQVPEVEERGIIITRSVTTFSDPIGEWVVGCIFLMAKRYPMLMKFQREGFWLPVPHEPPADPIRGRTVCIIGTGGIGREVAWRCDALGMRVLGLRRNPTPMPYFEQVVGQDQLPMLLKEADFLVLSSPLTPLTRGMIGAEQFKQMKPTAYLINIGRGALTVEKDLVQALQEGWIAGACLDVFETEPLPAESPLWSMENTIITPHYSYSSPEGLDRAIDEFGEQLKLFLRGEPVANQFNKERGY